MKIPDKLAALFGPLDVVTVERDFETLIDKNEEPDIFKECIDYAEEILGAGEYPDRNPSWWQTFLGVPVELGSTEWREGISNILRLTSSHKISELDNSRNHLQITIRVDLLVINAKTLPETAFNGAKCVSVKTAFGTFPVTGA